MVFSTRAQVRDGGQFIFAAQKVDTPILLPDLPLTHPTASILGVTLISQSVSQVPAVPSELLLGQLWGEPAPPQPPGCLGLLLFSTFLQGFWRQLFSSDFFVTTAGKEEAEIDNVQTRQNLHDVI